MSDIKALIGDRAESLGALLPAFQVVLGMANTYPRIKFAKKRCKVVIKRAAVAIRDIHDSLAKSRISQPPNVSELETKLQDIQTIMNRIAEMSFFKALLRFDEINLEIEAANHHLTDCLHLFQIELLVLHVQPDKEKAAKQDREDLNHVLQSVAGNYPEIRRQFDLRSQEDEDEAMFSMDMKLRNTNTSSRESVEMQVIQKSLECIKATTGRNTPKHNTWLITKYDLEDLGTIGGGGFSTVSKAQYRGLVVAVKTLKDFGNTKKALESEVEIWSRLRHDHIVPFYGASTLSHPPYIVARYMPNGNLVQYLAKNPNTNCTRMVFQVSLGMFYLHAEQIVHGDLKGVNVLVDDSGKACITDFGLSKACSTRAVEAETGKISGTLRFLAPEALRGHPLTFETDVYAFGMLIYEVFAGEVPFINKSDDEVRQGSVELCRPTSSKASERGFNDTLWRLLSECISRQPSARPRFQDIQARFHLINKVESYSQRTNSAADGTHVTNWVNDTYGAASTTLGNSRTMLLPKGTKFASEEKLVSPQPRVTQDIQNVTPICVQVTLKHFGIKFSILSKEPGVYLEENNIAQWQPIRPTKRSLLRTEADRFTCQSGIGEGRKSWILESNDVTLQSSSIERVVCHFGDARTAQKWFELELSFAKDGTLGEWSKFATIGDWFHTVQSWRRVKRGKIQKAGWAEDVSTSVAPSDNAWTDVSFPKQLEIDSSDPWTTHRLVCITNPSGSQPGKLTCRLEGRKIVTETYRLQNDTRPTQAREELYPSGEDAGVMFQALKEALMAKINKKNNRFSILSF